MDARDRLPALGRQVEEAIVVDAPDLRGFIPRNAAACLRDHRVKRPVGQIVHPRGWRVIRVEADFPVLVVKLVHNVFRSLSG